AAQRLTEIAGNRAQLHVHVEIDASAPGPGVRVFAENRRFEKTATVEHVAPHGDLEHAVRAAIGPQRGLVACGKRIGLEIHVDQIAVLIDFDRSLDRYAATFDDDVLKTGRLRLL